MEKNEHLEKLQELYKFYALHYDFTMVQMAKLVGCSYNQFRRLIKYEHNPTRRIQIKIDHLYDKYSLNKQKRQHQIEYLKKMQKEKDELFIDLYLDK